VSAALDEPRPAPRRPTNPPPDLGALVEAPLRRTGDLPAGTFQYPVKESRGGNKVLFVLLGLIVLGVGFAAMVFLFPKAMMSDSAAPKETDVVAAAPADAAIEVVVVDSAVLEVEPIEPPAQTPPTPPPPTTVAKTTTTAKTAANTATRPPRGGTPTTTRPATATSPTTTAPAGSGSAQEPEDTVENAPNNPHPTAGDCDEVSCVLTKYDRPCCEKFRPKDSGIAQRTAGGLPAELDKSMVRAGIEKVKARVVACGEKASDKGMVKVAVSVRPDGSVSEASIVAAPSPALGDCVIAAMKKAAFGKSVGGGSFTYPFSF
jgi:outer membrane biosynthesis protein TonB